MADTNVTIDVGEKMTGMLGALAEKLGMSVETMFPWYVKQQIIEGTMYLSIFSFFLLSGLLTVAVCWKPADFKYNDNDGNGWAWALIVGVILVIVGMVCFIFGGAPNISKVLNPEYHALKDVVRHLSFLR